MSKEEKQAATNKPEQAEPQAAGSPFWRGVGNVVSEIVYERGAHGSAELASALYTGQGYVAYGHAKPAPEIEPMDAQQQQDNAGQKQQGGVHGEAQPTQMQGQRNQPDGQQATQEPAAPKPQADLAERQDAIAPPKQAAEGQQQQQRQGPRQ